jgi:hypothetical protein
MKHDNSVILLISDMHIPYQHPDTMDFLTLVKETYSPTRIVCVGDEVDKHAMSFHDSDPDLPSAGDELNKAIEQLQPLYKLFPKMDLVDSNHGSMVYRKGKHHGIPRKYLRDYGDILDAPSGWNWHNNLLIPLPTSQDMYVTHGISKNGLKLAKEMGCNVVQGHYHTEFNIQYGSSPSQLYWSMQVGCSIDDKALAFHYNKTTAARPIIGHGIVINGHPMLLPMVLDRHNKWIKELV